MRLFLLAVATLVSLTLFNSCQKDDDTTNQNTPHSFRITLTNTVNFLNALVFNTPVNASEPGPLTTEGSAYTISFKAVQGSHLNFATMLAETNDWFFAPNEAGIALFDNAGNPITGDITDQVILWDAGTEEEDPTTIATVAGGATAGIPDDNTNIRVLPNNVRNYLRVVLGHDSNSTFTLSIQRTTIGVITPGLVVIHAQPAPFFTTGEADRGVGLELLAETGNPSELQEWFNEMGTGGAPLRLSSSLTPFSPGVVYAFSDDADPLFTQGESATAASGLEALAEDGSTNTMYNYLLDLGLSVAQNDAPILPGNSHSFTVEARPGDRLGFATMFVQSNDWFLAFNNDGVHLFDDSGNPNEGTGFSIQAYLFDAGTEVDQSIGFGADQVLRQTAPNTGAVDSNPNIRRVGEIEDEQFGKGMIISAPGVVGKKDPRGGYNLIEVNIEVL